MAVRPISERVQARLRAAGLEPKHLERADSHILVSDEAGRLHALVKADSKHGPVAGLTAEIQHQGKKLVALGLEERARIPLEGLGEFRDFVLEPLDHVHPLLGVHDKLAINLAAEGFHASVDLHLALQALSEGDVLVRPIPAGKRDGRQFVRLDSDAQSRVGHALGHAVDDVVDAEVVDQALHSTQQQAWAAHQDTSYMLSLSYALGRVPDLPGVPDVPVPKRAKKNAAAEVPVPGLSAETRAYLDKRGVEVPEGHVGVEWAEKTLDSLPEDVPERVAVELADAYEAAQKRSADEDAEMFGVAAPQTPEVHAGQASHAQSVAYKTAQLTEGARGMGVPVPVIHQLAEHLAGALKPSNKPAVIILSGPRGSAADQLFGMSTRLVGDNPLVLSDLASSGLTHGHLKGVPAQGEAELRTANLDAHRKTLADPVPLVVRDLRAPSAVGDPTPTEQLTVKRLEAISSLAQVTRTKSYIRQGEFPVQADVPLGNTVFLARWPGSRGELDRVLQQNPDLRWLKTKVVDVPEGSPADGVSYLLSSMSQELQQRLGKSATVRLSPELGAGIESYYQENGATASYALWRDRLLPALHQATQVPAQSYELSLSRRFTEKGKQTFLSGGSVPFVTQPFQINAGEGEAAPVLRFTQNWEDIVLENQQLRAQAAARAKP
jgi:hypothetical protein